MMGRHCHNQAGSGLVQFFFCFALLGIVALISVRLAPVYVENMQIKLSLDELKHDGDLLNRNNDEIMAFLQKNWERNRVISVTTEQVRIDRKQNSLKLELVYDVVKPMVGNIDSVLHFHDGFEVNQYQ